MSMYTTGELAKLCGVTVRTVQYYDTQDILKPSELTEGGRRLYSEEDKQKMELICTLRDMDLSLDVIRKIFKEENSKAVIETFLVEKRFELNHELEEKKKQVEKIDGILQAVQGSKDFSLNLIGDMAKQMERKKKLKKMRAIVLAVGIPAEIIEITTFILWIKTGNWIPFVSGMLVVILASIWICWFYMKQVSYICPECHKIFIAGFWENFWAPHTPNTRKLTCPCCGKKSYCIETYREPGDGLE